jgi:DNA-3-methyladenine glycosylase II
MKPAAISLKTEQATMAASALEAAKLLPLTRSGWSVYEGLRHLIASDGRFSDVIQKHGVPPIYDTRALKQNLETVSYIPVHTETSSFNSLLKAIIYQQLSGKSAEPIFKRLSIALGAESGRLVEPHHVHNADIAVIFVEGKKKITVNGEVSGLSESKSKYMVDLAEHFSDAARLKGVDLSRLSDADLFARLAAVKGLGPWSVHMHMLFDLQRPNVLAPGDLGIRRGLSLFHGQPPTYFESKARQKEIPSVCAAWAPYASLGCWYMWRVAEDKELQKTAATATTSSKRKKANSNKKPSSEVCGPEDGEVATMPVDKKKRRKVS